MTNLPRPGATKPPPVASLTRVGARTSTAAGPGTPAAALPEAAAEHYVLRGSAQHAEAVCGDAPLREPDAPLLALPCGDVELRALVAGGGFNQGSAVGHKVLVGTIAAKELGQAQRVDELAQAPGCLEDGDHLNLLGDPGGKHRAEDLQDGMHGPGRVGEDHRTEETRVVQVNRSGDAAHDAHLAVVPPPLHEQPLGTGHVLQQRNITEVARLACACLQDVDKGLPLEHVALRQLLEKAHDVRQARAAERERQAPPVHCLHALVHGHVSDNHVRVGEVPELDL
eukprot:CAMPEP_0175187224 /NCGR_PEP_ID=MMETSP0093-20121207/2801_1 /TAXON_ID=311494 /ORGANISM="Alexandrium monilatum, Strain CCMP3105" /LENGTH=282 /DNA_ID=CAMNT_0016479979 /DNA_START=207 /DNA_END=1053 /DNA_ORIENTATION=+